MVLFKVNGKEDVGVDLARDYGVKGYPTFIVVDAEGEIIRSWIGYSEPGGFISELEAAVADPVSIVDRMERYAAEPSEADAVALAVYHESRMELDKSLEYFRAARAMSAEPEGAYVMEIFTTTSWAVREGLVELDEMVAAADDVLAAPSVDPDDALLVGLHMAKVTSKLDRRDVAAPYIEAGVQAADGAALDERGRKMLRSLNVNHALIVDGDAERAAELKKASMASGWEEDPNELNGFAWWCFENRVNLEEAEQLALRGAELAEKPSVKANIYDTLAEVRFARGDREGALEAIRESVRLDPESEYFAKQLDRFTNEVDTERRTP